jgi:hypothetical protein
MSLGKLTVKLRTDKMIEETSATNRDKISEEIFNISRLQISGKKNNNRAFIKVGMTINSNTIQESVKSLNDFFSNINYEIETVATLLDKNKAKALNLSAIDLYNKTIEKINKDMEEVMPLIVKYEAEDLIQLTTPLKINYTRYSHIDTLAIKVILDIDKISQMHETLYLMMAISAQESVEFNKSLTEMVDTLGKDIANLYKEFMLEIKLNERKINAKPIETLPDNQKRLHYAGSLIQEI